MSKDRQRIQNKEQFRTALDGYLKAEAASAADASASYSRQIEPDPFNKYYSDRKVIRPPYDFDWLFSLREESDLLQSNIAVMDLNVTGMGYELDYEGEDAENKPSEALAEETTINNFFDEPNPDESFLELTFKLWDDYETAGQCAIEGVRSQIGDLNFIYHHPIRECRLVPITKEDIVLEDVIVMRNGKPKTIKTKRLYRRYVKILWNGKLRYYKAWGDKRPMRTDGTRQTGGEQATEMLWIGRPWGGDARGYGLPRWIASAFDFSGRRNAQYVNWNFLKSGAFPPLIVAIDGELSEDSWDDVWNMILGNRGVENFNNIWVLEAKPAVAVVGTGQKGSASIKVERPLAGRPDQMFENYMKGAQERGDQAFRIPPSFKGQAADYSYSTMQVSKNIGEEQVFGPEKAWLAKIINRIFFKREWGIKYWSFRFKSAEIAGPQDLLAAMEKGTTSGSISLNNAVKLLNSATGRRFSLFKEKWADYPLNLLTPVVNRESLIGMDEITVKSIEPKPQPNPVEVLPPEKPTLKVLPGGLAKVEDVIKGDVENLLPLLNKALKLYGHESKIEKAERIAKKKARKLKKATAE